MRLSFEEFVFLAGDWYNFKYMRDKFDFIQDEWLELDPTDFYDKIKETFSYLQPIAEPIMVNYDIEDQMEEMQLPFKDMRNPLKLYVAYYDNYYHLELEDCYNSCEVRESIPIEITKTIYIPV